MDKVPFTKAEMLAQLETAILLFVRSTSWVLDFDAAYRLLGWNSPTTSGSLTNVSLERFSEIAEDEGHALDLSRFSVVRTFGDLYDYGVLGVLQSTIFPIENATEATFAMAFIYDCAQSQLQFEMQGGGDIDVSYCIHAAEAAMARQVLDGGERALIGSENKPDGLLTMREIALLANIEERSVRNAASGQSRPDLLKTTLRDGDRYVTPADAIEWLEGRRSFKKTQRVGSLVDLDLRTRAFVGSWEVADFVRQRLAASGHGLDQAMQKLGLPESSASPEARLRDIGALCDGNVAQRLAEVIEVDPDLLALRLNECRTMEQLESLRRSIATVRGRS